MRAELLYETRQDQSEESFVEICIWSVPTPVLGSSHAYKYSLAYIVNDKCALRYDNERGKGDYRHLSATEVPYAFTTPEALIADFWKDVHQWKPK